MKLFIVVFIFMLFIFSYESIATDYEIETELNSTKECGVKIELDLKLIF